MKETGSALYNFFLNNYWTFIEVLLLLVLSILLSYSITFIYKKFHPKFVKSKRFWDDALIISLSKPLKSAIWLTMLTLIAHVLVNAFAKDKDLFNFIEPVRKIGIILIFLWFFISFIRQMEKNLFKISLNKNRMDKTSIRALSQLLRLAAIIIGILIFLQTLGIPISGVVAFAGVSGIGVSFAAKDMLANFFGGLMIFLDRPFAIGDWIRSPDKNIEGTVEQIGWRLTRIRTFDKRPLYIPNGIFLSIAVENPSRMHNRRIKTTIGLRYEDSFKIDAIVKDVEAMLQTHPEIDQDKVLFVKLVNFGPSALEILVYTFTKTTQWVLFQKIQQDVFLKIIDIIKTHDAQCAFPTTTVHFAEEHKQMKPSS